MRPIIDMHDRAFTPPEQPLFDDEGVGWDWVPVWCPSHRRICGEVFEWRPSCVQRNLFNEAGYDPREGA